MPLVIDAKDEGTAQLEEVVDFLRDNKIDTSDNDSMVEASFMLKRLGNNRHFLADMALEELKTRNNLEPGAHSYTPQVMMLFQDRGAGDNFYIRANMWPSAQDHILQSSGEKQFFYHVPHDHSFNFLTVGYLGPGYKSNYFEYDYDAVAGYPGEEVPLRYIETSALEEGKVMLYRASVDVHDQLPGESMSISLNIMQDDVKGYAHDQYGFDLKNNSVSSLMNRVASGSLLPLIAGLRTDNSLDFLCETAKSHPIGRVRCSALSALASAMPELTGAMRVYEGALADDQEMVRGYAEFHLKRLNGFAVLQAA
ncbi:MAG TPA: transposase [Allosphingosinicella sp.]|nr:transposase [Allosphingosinicella sp.]